jgi:hypothetical protein
MYTICNKKIKYLITFVSTNQTQKNTMKKPPRDTTIMAYVIMPLMFFIFLLTSCSKNELLVTPYGSEGTPPTRPVEDRTIDQLRIEQQMLPIPYCLRDSQIIQI